MWGPEQEGLRGLLAGGIPRCEGAVSSPRQASLTSEISFRGADHPLEV